MFFDADFTESIQTHFSDPAAGNSPGTSPVMVIWEYCFGEKKNCWLYVSGLSDPGDNVVEAPLVEYVLSSL